MDRSIKPLDIVYGGAVGVAQRQRVLRNTYALLALSMVPTVLGAWLGVAMGGFSLGGPLMTLVAFMAISFAFFFGIQKFKDSGVPAKPTRIPLTGAAVPGSVRRRCDSAEPRRSDRGRCRAAGAH